MMVSTNSLTSSSKRPGAPILSSFAFMDTTSYGEFIRHADVSWFGSLRINPAVADFPLWVIGKTRRTKGVNSHVGRHCVRINVHTERTQKTY